MKETKTPLTKMLIELDATLANVEVKGDSVFALAKARNIAKEIFDEASQKEKPSLE